MLLVPGGSVSHAERLVELLEANVEKIEAELKLWTAKIDELTASAQKSNGWARIDLRQRIDDLKVRRALVRAKLDELESAGSDNREGLRIGLERVWNELKAAFDELKL